MSPDRLGDTAEREYACDFGEHVVMLTATQLLDLVHQPLSWFNFLQLMLGTVAEAEMEIRAGNGEITKIKVSILDKT